MVTDFPGNDSIHLYISQYSYLRIQKKYNWEYRRFSKLRLIAFNYKV